ncbi:MAG: helix-turn-helix transcriptional regulator [Clostridia bacterium]|nr:helix-turn-helix transcriptional regulator [Clostridia bacterium]
MNVSEAAAKRIRELLIEKDMTQYRLEQKSGILHGSMACILNGRNKTVTLSTIYMLARGFDMTIIEFLNDDIFLSHEVEFE